MLVDHVDEVHGFRVEAEQTHPSLEIEMLLLHFFNQGRENILHLLLQHKQLGNLGVGVLANDVFELGPLHLLALLVKKGAFALRGDALFADKGRFSAARVYTDHHTAIAVDTVRTVLDGFIHIK